VVRANKTLEGRKGGSTLFRMLRERVVAGQNQFDAHVFAMYVHAVSLE
jgi:hypothetical protein